MLAAGGNPAPGVGVGWLGELIGLFVVGGEQERAAFMKTRL